MINQIERKIELGKQLGINQMVQKGHRDYWYSYAVQKKGNTYYVYEEGVINFVSLRFYLPMISSIGYCQNFQYLQGFVGSAHTRPPE